jgi:hypothetical protein
MTYYTCCNLEEVGLDFECCSSCHEDFEEGYNELCEYYSPNDEHCIMTCCGGAIAIDELFGDNGIPPEFWNKLKEAK